MTDTSQSVTMDGDLGDGKPSSVNMDHDSSKNSTVTTALPTSESEQSASEDVSSTGASPEVSPESPFEPDEEWQECSLCDAADCCDSQMLPLPGRESHTSDLDRFLHYVNLVQQEPRLAGIEPPFNENFWVFCKDILEKGIPIGYSELPDREGVIPKSNTDSGLLIMKYIQLSPLNPAYPNQLSHMSGIPLNEVLTELLYATKVGMMSMRWTPLCERCGTPTCANIENIAKVEMPLTSWCRSCRFENPIDCLSKINVVFVLNNDVLYVLAESMACKPSNLSLSLSVFYTMVPATFSGSGFQFSVGCDGERMIRPEIPKGVYRMHCPIALTDNWFVVERDATPEDEPHLCEVHVSDHVYRGGKRNILSVPHGRIRFNVFCDTQSFFILWIQHNLDHDQLMYVPLEERPLSTSAAVVMQCLTYKKLYEGTDIEKTHFEGAVAKMTLGPA